MINVDISNIWGQLSLQDLLGIEQEIFAAHEALGDDTQNTVSGEELSHIKLAAETIRSSSETCVVIGSGAALLGAKAAVELLQGADRNLGKGKGDPQIFFTGEAVSTRKWKELKGKLEGKDVSVIVFCEPDAEDGCTPALRGLRWMLERKYGTDESSRRIHTVTSPEAGALLTMAVAGIDIAKFAQGEKEAREAYDLRSFENPVWLYAAVRSLMRRSGKAVELLSFWEPDCAALGKWWQHLFLDGEGGLFSVSMEFPADLPSLDRSLQQNRLDFFETLVRFAPDEQPSDIDSDVSGMDDLEKKEEQAYMDALEAHTDRSVPVITVDCGTPDERTLGWLSVFLQLSSAVSGRAGASTESAE